MRTSAGVVYLHSDHLGSTSATSGQTVSAQTYYPYGTIRTTTRTLPTDFGFTGQRRDASAGLMYYNARYYDSVLGRFISADTIVPNHFYPQDLNRYTYARNSPVRYTDPNGHCPVCVVVAILLVGGFTTYDYLSNPDVAYAPGTTTDLNSLPDSDLPDNDIALCAFCYYGEHGEWGMAALAGAVELTPFDEIPGANNVFRRIYKALPDFVQTGSSTLRRTDYYSRFNAWAASKGIKNIPHDWQRHHGLPQELADEFEARGVDIHDPSNMFLLPEDLHRAIHIDIEQFRGIWNDEWAEWLFKNPKATAKDIFDELDRLAKKYGIDEYRGGAYYDP